MRFILYNFFYFNRTLGRILVYSVSNIISNLHYKRKTRCIIRYIRSIFIHPLSSWINGILLTPKCISNLSFSLFQLEKIDADLAIPIAEIKRDIVVSILAPRKATPRSVRFLMDEEDRAEVWSANLKRFPRFEEIRVKIMINEENTWF